MVERTAAGEAPSSPQPPEAGAHRARLLRRCVRRGESELTDNVAEPVRCRHANVNDGAVSADFQGYGFGLGQSRINLLEAT